MKLGKVWGIIAGSTQAVTRVLSWVACGVLGIMALVVFGNVVGRYFLNMPLLGTIELVELMMVVIGFFAIPYTTMERRHITVRLLVSRLSRRTQAILRSIGFFLSAGIFANMACCTSRGKLVEIPLMYTSSVLRPSGSRNNWCESRLANRTILSSMDGQ